MCDSGHAGRGKFCEKFGRERKTRGRIRFEYRNIDTLEKCIVHALKVNEISASIHNRDIRFPALLCRRV